MKSARSCIPHIDSGRKQPWSCRQARTLTHTITEELSLLLVRAMAVGLHWQVKMQLYSDSISSQRPKPLSPLFNFPSWNRSSVESLSCKVGFRVMLTVSENEGVKFSKLSLKKTMTPRRRHDKTTSRAVNKMRLGKLNDAEASGYSLRKATTDSAGYTRR